MCVPVFSFFSFLSGTLASGLSTYRIHLHRDYHDVFTLRRRLLFRVCQLQCLRRDGSPPLNLLPQPAHQGAPHQLEPNGRYRELKPFYPCFKLRDRGWYNLKVRRW